MNTSNWSYSGSDKMRNGHQLDYIYDQRSNSALTKMQRRYWVTKQSVMKKLGKKDDDNIVASDAELDAKLELFRSIQDSCSDLQRVIDRYQERILLLAQEENALGRFLKDSSKNDKTGAGAMMLSVGKTMSNSGQLRLNLRSPLVRLFQEVDTFRGRAVEDTLRTVEAMEKSRTEYRGTLNWMKDVSTQLDPDSYNQLEKFKKVQNQVKKSKGRFDKLKLDCLQKVDLLAAARCNMFSHALIAYHSALLAFASASLKAFSQITDSAKEHRKFEFTVIKELSEIKLDDKPEEDNGEPGEATEATETSSVEQQTTSQLPVDNADDKLLDFDDLVESDMAEPKKEESGSSKVETPEFLLTSEQFMPSQLLLSELSSVNQELKKPSTPGKTPPPNKVSSWLDLFSELDPLSNPDSIGQSSNEPQRNC